MGLKLNLLAWALGVAVLLSSALGVDSAGFGVSGAILKAEALPGEEIRHQMVVTVAEEGSPPGAKLPRWWGSARPWTADLLGLSPRTTPAPSLAREFLRASPERFHIEPGSSEGLGGEIPSDVGAGGRYALVEIRTLPAAGDGPRHRLQPYTSRSI